MRESLAYKRFTREIRHTSESENARDWSDIKASLLKLADRIYRRSPSRYLARYGIKAPSYVDLLFFDAISVRSVTSRYGVRRPLALAGLAALEGANDREVGRAMLLLSFHSSLRTDYRQRLRASQPRQKIGKPSHAAVLHEARRLIEREVPRHSLARRIEQEFRRSTPITARAIRDILRKNGR